jgi:hypothetical protein
VSWITSLFTSSAPVKDVFDKDNGLLAQAGGWFGNQNFTVEEAAEMNAKTAEGVRAFVVATLEENTDRSKSRREIAQFIIKLYGIMVFMCGMTFPIDPEWSAMWYNLATSLALGGLVASISVFYFGSHAVAKFQQKSK